MVNLVQIGVDLIPQNGGVHKSALQFSEAFGQSPIISFTQKRAIDRLNEGTAGLQHYPLSANRLLEWYGYAPSAVRAEASKVVREADLLCCNVMLRHHAIWTRQVAKYYRIPYWFVAHGQLDPYVYTYRSAVKKIWLRCYGRRILRDAAHVIFATEQEQKKASWFYKGNNTRVVHWPVELLSVEKREQAKIAIHKQLGLAHSERILLFFGRLHSIKNPRKMIEAFARANAKNTHLVIVGPDHDETAESCIKAASLYGAADRTHVIGAAYGELKEMFFLAADAFISLSMKENFGHTAAEALSAATPVILSPGNDLGPELAPSNCGWLLPDDNLDTAIQAIREFDQIPEDRLRAMGGRGREFVVQKLSMDVFRHRLQELALEAIRNNKQERKSS